jgi:hypothetical protein
MPAPWKTFSYLAWYLGLCLLLPAALAYDATSSIDSGTLSPADPVPSVGEPVALAIHVLRGATRFNAAQIGFAGIAPPELLAWRTIADSPQAESLFAGLAVEGTRPGRLYGLAGLYWANSQRYAALGNRLLLEGGIVPVGRGCILMDQPVEQVLAEIGRGRWSREFLVGKLLTWPRAEKLTE